MVIYFFQLANILPSLQMLAEEPRPIADIDYWSFQREFDVAFLSSEEYLRRRQAAGDEGAARPDLSMADILYGFYRFFTQEYKWGSEIVSIRRPDRRAADAWWRLYGKPHPEAGIQVEDPIELRDLNIVLRRDRLAQLKVELAGALDILQRGGSLEELTAGALVAAPPDHTRAPARGRRAPRAPKPCAQQRQRG